MQWIDILKDNIVSFEELSKKLPDIKEREQEYKDIIDKYPLSITRYCLSLIDSTDVNDPIRKMNVPSLDEALMVGEADTSGENDNTVLPGLQHKYKQSALMLSNNYCATYCRYCFRKRMVGLDDGETLRNLDKAFDYIRNHKEINNVIISGGDSLLNNNDVIIKYLDNLSNIDHLNFIRFGTKTPVTLPQRINQDKQLLDIFQSYGRKKRIYVVTQFNHIKELTPEALKAVDSLRKVDVIVKNQSVLMRGVNDKSEVLSALLQRLTEVGIVPYYVFQCRPVKGVKSQFQIPLKEGCKIVEEAKGMQNGQAKCFKYVMSTRQGKIEILGQIADDEMLFKFHEAKDERRNGEIFTKKIDDNVYWVD